MGITVGYTLRSIAMDAVKFTRVIVKNVTKAKTPVGRVPLSGSRGQSAPVCVCVCVCVVGQVKHGEIQWKVPLSGRTQFLVFVATAWALLKLDLRVGVYTKLHGHTRTSQMLFFFLMGF